MIVESTGKAELQFSSESALNGSIVVRLHAYAIERRDHDVADRRRARIDLRSVGPLRVDGHGLARAHSRRDQNVGDLKGEGQGSRA